MATPPAEQCVVYFTGHVQGVGFRYTTCRVAAGCDVTGYVKNLEDGRVELVAEGSRAEINRLLAGVEEQLGGHIRNQTIDRRPATGQYADFSIRH